MKYLLVYFHPVTGNVYCFKSFRDNGKPVGCMAFTQRMKAPARIFDSVDDAFPVAKLLASLGYRVRFCLHPLGFYSAASLRRVSASADENK